MLMREPSPVLDCAALFPPLHDELFGLLGALTPEQWQAATRAGDWRVRDVAGHLLDGDLRKLSFHRDRHPPQPPPEADDAYAGLVAFINALNREGVDWARRLSPRVLLELLRFTGPQVSQLVASLDPFGTRDDRPSRPRSSRWTNAARGGCSSRPCRKANGARASRSRVTRAWPRLPEGRSP